MTIDTKLAKRQRSSKDDRLANLEAVWRLATDAFDAAYECGFEESVYDAIARRIEDAEKRVAVTPARTAQGVAVKLRIILRHEKNEADRRQWFAILQSALVDLEALTAAEKEDER